jgi:hypothetical protein
MKPFSGIEEVAEDDEIARHATGQLYNVQPGYKDG